MLGSTPRMGSTPGRGGLGATPGRSVRDRLNINPEDVLAEDSESAFAARQQQVNNDQYSKSSKVTCVLPL